MKKIILSALFVLVGCVGIQKSFSAEYNYKYQSYSGMTDGEFADFYEIVDHLEKSYNLKMSGEKIDDDVFTTKFGLMELTFDEFCKIRDNFMTVNAFKRSGTPDWDTRFMESIILGNHFFNIFDSLMGEFKDSNTTTGRKRIFIPYSLDVRVVNHKALESRSTNFKRSLQLNPQDGLDSYPLMDASAITVEKLLMEIRKK